MNFRSSLELLPAKAKYWKSSSDACIVSTKHALLQIIYNKKHLCLILMEARMSEEKKGMDRNTYLSKNVGDFAEKLNFGDQVYIKVEDLRYGTNPHQPAAFYKPEGVTSPIGDMKILKTG